MPDTHITPRRPKSYFSPDHVSDNSDPDTDVEDLQLPIVNSPSLTSSECTSQDSDPASEPPSETSV